MWGRTLITRCTAVAGVLPKQVLGQNKYSWCLLVNTACCRGTPDSLRSLSCLPFICEKNAWKCGNGIDKRLLHCSDSPSLTSFRENHSSTSLYTRTRQTDFKSSSVKIPRSSVYCPSNKFPSHGVESSVVLPTGMPSSARHISRDRGGFTNIHSRLSALQLKKRSQKKKKQIQVDAEEAGKTAPSFTPAAARHRFLTFDPDFTLPEIQVHRPPPHEWQVTAYATADEYSLDKLLASLNQQGLYTASTMNSDASESDVLHAVATYQLETEHREIYFFREGSVVFWNVAELERSNVLKFLEAYEEGKYDEEAVQEECESLTYKYSEGQSKTKLLRDQILLNPEGQTNLEKYTFSNALTMSVKLGIWEASLDKYIDNIEYVSEELSKTGKVVLSQDQVLQRMGQLFALRHLINLGSDLLDVPDFYWEHEQLELLYKKTSDHLNISKRTSVMNVKLNHCVELMELLQSHLHERHSARLEWIIIILIMVEVGFELLHFLERLL